MVDVPTPLKRGASFYEVKSHTTTYLSLAAVCQLRFVVGNHTCFLQSFESTKHVRRETSQLDQLKSETDLFHVDFPIGRAQQRTNRLKFLVSKTISLLKRERERQKELASRRICLPRQCPSGIDRSRWHC